MAAIVSSKALVPSQDENRTGWNRLPNELKMEIFEHLTEPNEGFYEMTVPTPPGFRLHDSPHDVECSWERFLWPIRKLSKCDCMIYEQVIKKSIGSHGLWLFVEMPYSKGENTPLEISDDIHCVLDLHWSTSRPTTWYMRTWCGIAVAAYEAFKARIETSTSIFSFDVARMELIVSQALDRTRKGMIHEISPDASRGLDDWFPCYVQNAFAFLCVKQTVNVIVNVKEFENAAPANYINLIHDLRYFAGNSLLEVEVQVEFHEDDHEKWITWLQAVGGQIKWVFNTET